MSKSVNLIQHFFKAGFSYVETPPVTDELLQQLQDEVGVRLPDLYVDLLRIQNGGVPRKSLFEVEDERQYVLNQLPGIGENRGCKRDLLADQSLLDPTKNHDFKGFLILDWEWEEDGGHYIALDYRTCGPTGEPWVTHIATWEAEVWYTTITQTFDEFVAGLKRKEEDCYIGFVCVPSEGDALRRALEQCLQAITRDIVDDDFKGDERIFISVQPSNWTYNERITLKPNTDYAISKADNKGNYSFRPAGLFFPEHPECSWMLECEQDQAKIQELLTRLKALPFSYVVMHEGRESDWAIPCDDELEEPLVITDFSKFRVEVMPTFGYKTHAWGTGKDSSRSTYAVLGKDTVLRIEHLKLKIGDSFFGMVEDGDHIIAVDEHAVFVNGQKREEQKE